MKRNRTKITFQSFRTNKQTRFMSFVRIFVYFYVRLWHVRQTNQSKPVATLSDLRKNHSKKKPTTLSDLVRKPRFEVAACFVVLRNYAISIARAPVKATKPRSCWYSLTKVLVVSKTKKNSPHQSLHCEEKTKHTEQFCLLLRK